MSRRINGFVGVVLLVLGTPGAARAGSLWIGNDLSTSIPVQNTDLNGNKLRRIDAPIQVSGIAIDPVRNILYTGGNVASAAITPRDLTTLAISGPSFTPAVIFQEDMAFDGTSIWRINSQHILEKINPNTGNLDASIPFTLAGAGTVGLAWDGTNFWISELVDGGKIRQITSAGAFTGVEFSVASNFSPGGLAYDTTDNTLFIGTFGAVYHYSLTGKQLGSFALTRRGLVDGLEFEAGVPGVPEPSGLTLIFTGGLALLAKNLLGCSRRSPQGRPGSPGGEG